MATVTTRNWMRASVSGGLDAAVALDAGKAREAEDDHSRQVGVVELVGRLGGLVDEEVTVPVDHPVGVLSVGGPDAGPFDDQHLGLHMLRGIALRGPDDLEAQGHDGGAHHGHGKGHHAQGPTSPDGRPALLPPGRPGAKAVARP